MKLPPEKPTRLRQNVLRAVSEGVVSTGEGERILGEPVEKRPTLSLIQRKALMEMSVEERRRHLREQAERIAEEYQPDADWQAASGDAFVEY